MPRPEPGRLQIWKGKYISRIQHSMKLQVKEKKKVTTERLAIDIGIPRRYSCVFVRRCCTHHCAMSFPHSPILTLWPSKPSIPFALIPATITHRLCRPHTEGSDLPGVSYKRARGIVQCFACLAWICSYPPDNITMVFLPQALKPLFRFILRFA